MSLRAVTRLFVLSGLIPPVVTGAQITIRRDSVRLAPHERLVVRLSAPPRAAHGAGIIIGVENHVMYIATARHVLDMLDTPPTVRIAFFPDTLRTVLGTVHPLSYSDSAASQYDLALVTVDERLAEFRLSKGDFARLTDRRHFRSGDRVYSVGCPEGVCWSVPVDETMLSVRELLTFVTQFVRAGNSGGALFTEWGEVAGMVLQSKPPIARAVSIEQLKKELETWGAKVSLTTPLVPPWPYRLELSGSLLTSNSRERRRYSGLFTIEASINRYLSWHLGAVQLAPENRSVASALGGFAVRWRVWGLPRLTASLFADAGIARVDARRDLGGYFVMTPAGSRYEASWLHQSTFAFGGGVGGSLSAVVIRGISVQALISRWDFEMPPDTPPLPAWYAGVGVRTAVPCRVFC